MDPVDLYNAEGRRIAEERRHQDAVNNRAPMDGKSPWARLLNRWVLLAIVVGFPLGYLIEPTPEGAFAGAIMLGGAAFVVTIVLILFRVSFGAVASGAGAAATGASGLGGVLGGLPLWTVLGAAAGAAAGAGLAIWLDGDASDIIAPALRLAPIGAATGFVVRAITLTIGAMGRK